MLPPKKGNKQPKISTLGINPLIKKEPKAIKATHGDDLHVGRPEWQHVYVTKDSVRRAGCSESLFNAEELKTNTHAPMIYHFEDNTTLGDVTSKYVNTYTGIMPLDEADIDTTKPPRTNTPRKRQVISTDSNMTEICEVPLGAWRSVFMLQKEIEGILIGKRVTEVTDTKTIYTTIILCVNEKLVEATTLCEKIITENKNIKNVNWR